MISALNKNLPKSSKRAFSLLELAVTISITSLILYSTTQLTSFTGLFFRRMKVASTYEYEVAPVDLLQRTQIRQCKFSVYPDRSTALTNLPADRTPTGPVIRCERYDGNGWFLLVWEDATKTLWLEPGNTTSSVTTNASYPFASLNSVSFDVSQGVLQTTVSIIAAMDYTLRSPTPSTPVTIQYVFVTQNYF